eukprot:TRINITY_DN12067_c0_g1_i1.p1 TRINITY_DN12067_c0_g1~~TRINITY_DN12067_c0_g1_i1.p1  ORF type:complete len:413 (+),score=140.07 TRINITY_DN12067_c0_g1_i1:32-1240(+)
MDEKENLLDEEHTNGKKEKKDKYKKLLNNKSPTAKIKQDDNTVEFNDDEFFGGNGLNASVDVKDQSDLIIKCNNMHKTYLLGVEGVPALRGVSMTIKRGEFVCIFGTSGGGKTTMLNLLGTIDKPTKGSLNICDLKIGNKTSDKDLAKLRLHKLGFVFQTFNLLSSLTALENVEMPMILAGNLSATERKKRAISLLRKVGLAERLNHYPSQLSGGEQQRVTIARALSNKPDILLLDEPTGDLDTVNTILVMKLLIDLNKEEGITLVMVTHDVSLKFFSDRIIWMRDGKIQRIETVSENKKKQVYEDLKKDVEELERKRNIVTKQHKEENTWTNTKVRQPRDYKMFQNSKNKNYKNPFIDKINKDELPKEMIEVDFTFSEKNGELNSSQIDNNSDDLKEIIIN